MCTQTGNVSLSEACLPGHTERSQPPQLSNLCSHCQVLLAVDQQGPQMRQVLQCLKRCDLPSLQWRTLAQVHARQEREGRGQGGIQLLG